MRKSDKILSDHSDNNQENEIKIQLFERRIYDLRNLIELGISLSSNLDFESLVESILYSCIGQMFVEKVAILLQVDIDEDNLYIHMTKGYDPELDRSEVILTEDSPLVKYLEEHPEPKICSELESIAEFGSELSKLSLLSPELIVPMKSKNSLNGILILGKKLTGDTFSVNEKEFLRDLAKFAAIAVENSRLYLMATLDRMTRLYIHHYFQERLHDEIKRSIRNVTPLSFIMIDIDHFKKFNDTYGHQQGDLVLKEVATLLKEHVRNIDIPARYGGEEFAVILPETELDSALVISERLRQIIEEHEFPGQEIVLKVTVSLGVAQFNSDKDKNREDLIRKADRALYQAKQNGRNMVVADRDNV